MFQIQFTVTPNHPGLNTFTVNVGDANSGKPATNLHVQLSTTQGALSMAGNWEIHILLRTPDALLHEAQVHLHTQS